MPDELSPALLNRTRPLREQIYDIVRELILSGRIAPGDVLDEKLIALKLKVSRTPVREAVKKLSDEHLVDVVAQSGTRASQINRAEVEQAFLIRRALEMESAAQAAGRMTDIHREALQDIVQKQSRAQARQRSHEAIVHDDEFHRYIAEISKLDRLWRAIEISKAQLDRCRIIMQNKQGQGEATLRQHQIIIDALSSKQAEMARRAMADHLEAAFAGTLRAMDTGEIDTA